MISNTEEEEVHQIGALKIKKSKDGSVNVNDGVMVGNFAGAGAAFKFKTIASFDADHVSFSGGAEG